jgi:hypothetical protein
MIAAAEIEHARAVRIEDEITRRARLGAVMNLAGLIVRCRKRPCPDCQSVDCLIGSADVPHPYGQMICVVCDRHRGQINKRAHAFISEIIRNFGRPTEPIQLCIKNSSPSDEVTATAVATANQRSTL